MTDASGNTTSYAYDNVLNCISATDGDYHTSRYQYDARERLSITV
jgi:uncharacterized protein RhaS with RHS repeats